MPRGEVKMNRAARWTMAVLAATTTAALAAPTHAAVINYDTSAASGYQTGSGTWDANTTAAWSTDGTTLAPWTSNSDSAAFALAGSSSGGVLTVDNAAGQVSARGLLFSGSLGTGGTWQLGGSTLQLGAGGLHYMATSNSTLTIAAPLQLTASQTWTNNKSRSGTVVISGPISSIGTTDINFHGVSVPGTGDGVTFNVLGANSFTGATTVSGSATLTLDYTTNNNAKIDPTSTLTLNNGKIIQTGGSYAEAVAGTTLGAGANTINRGTGTATLNLGLVTRTAGATLDTNSGSYAVDNANTDGSFSASPSHILGGWATSFGSSGWVSAAGSGNTVHTTNGNASNDATTWTATSNVKWTGASSFSVTTDTSANVLQINNGAATTMTIGPAATVTLVSGGLMDSVGGSTIQGGKITTGMSTGELFVYAPKSAGFAISSQIVDNGATPTILVKGGAQTLTLSGANTYTGKTYVNSGRLALTGDAVGTVRGGAAVAASATFDAGGTYAVGAGNSLSGGGTVADAVDASGATINPGDGGTGILSILGGLTLDGNSILNFDLNDLASGAANDQIVLSGALTLDGTLNINNLGGLSDGTYTLISGATSITDDGLVLAGIPGFSGEITNDGSHVFLTVQAVPEPASIGLLGVAALGLLTRRRRR